MRAVTAILLIWAILATVVAAYNIQENHQLEKRAKELELDLKVYKTSNERVLQRNQEIWNNMTKLEEENRNLKIKISMLEQEKKELEQEIEQLKRTIYTLENTTEELKKVPKGYYSTDFFFREHSNTAEELKNFLKYEFHLPHSYVEGVFDCSEIASYTEWVLEDAGFDAYIAEGYYTTQGRAIGHTWVIVKIGNQQFYVDSTVMRKDDDRTILIPPEGYKVKPSVIYDNIYEAVEHDKSI